MNRLDIVLSIEENVSKELDDCPKEKQELQQVLNYLKLLFLDEIDLEEDLQWPEWTEDKWPISKGWMRKALLRAYDGQCFWTGELLHYKDMEVDHVIPKEEGGPDNFLNYVPCKTLRNRSKSDSLKTNRKLVATLYYVETVFKEKLEGQIRQVKKEAKKARERKEAVRAKKAKEMLHVDDMEKAGRFEVFWDFWENFDKVVERKLANKEANDKVQAFFQVVGSVLNASSIGRKLREEYNLKIAKGGRNFFYSRIHGGGWEASYRKAIVKALQKMGIQGDKNQLSYDKVKEMGIFSMRKYLMLTHFDKVVQERIYIMPERFDEELDKELARVMNRLAKYLESTVV